MTIISNYFDYLHFTECEFESFEIPNDGREKIHNARNNEIKDYEFENSKIRNPYSSLNNQQKYIIIGAEIVIVTRQIGILPGHPLNKTDDVIFLPQCNLIFNGVKSSVRHVTRYVEELPGANKFKPEEAQKETVTDVIFLTFDRPVTLFEIEGIFKNPLRWVDWEIESISFGLEVLTPQDTLSENYSKSVSGEMGKS